MDYKAACTLEASRPLFREGNVCDSVHRGLCPEGGGSLSMAGGPCQRGPCPVESLLRGSLPVGSLSRGSLSAGSLSWRWRPPVTGGPPYGGRLSGTNPTGMHKC